MKKYTFFLVAFVFVFGLFNIDSASANDANKVILNISRVGSDQDATVNMDGGSTSKVPLLQINVASQAGTPISINKIPVVLTTSMGANVDLYTTEVYLMNGTTILDSETIPVGAVSPYTVSFKINPNQPLIIQPNAQTTLAVVADINSVAGGGYVAGTALSAATPAGVSGDTSYDLTSNTPTGTELVNSTNEGKIIYGTARGQKVAFYGIGPTVNETFETCVANQTGFSGGPSTLTCTIGYSITANGAPVFIPQAAGTSTTANVIGFDSVISSAPGTPLVSGIPATRILAKNTTQIGTVAISSQSGAEWTINAGSTANFVGTVVINDTTSVSPGQYRSFLSRVVWGSTSSATTWNNIYSYNLGATNPVVPGYVQLN